MGLMGGSLAAALKAKGFEGTVHGISSPQSLARAEEAGLIDEGFTHDAFSHALDGADLVVLASPIHTIIENLSKLAPVAQPGTVVTDVGSTKSAISRHANEVLGEGLTFIGGHPMAGSEVSGVAAADAYLYENAVWVLTPTEESPEVERLTSLAQMTGARVVITEPDRHDRIAARISHLPQTLAIALMNLSGTWNDDDDLTLRLAAGGFRDLTRIASSPWEMWSDIYETNREAILDALDAFLLEVGKIRESVAEGALADLFEQANRLRLSVPKDTKGFMRPLKDVMVVVQDEPGVLSRITGSLAEHAINIRDIEVLKVREGEGGTMRLAFDSRELAESAVRHLADVGFRAWVRE
jgi:prephenate dehydrogenase